VIGRRGVFPSGFFRLFQLILELVHGFLKPVQRLLPTLFVLGLPQHIQRSFGFDLGLQAHQLPSDGYKFRPGRFALRQRSLCLGFRQSLLP
jgi:hypothetical protein